jgi:hypothetical protein
MKQTAREFYDAHYSDDAVVMMIDFAKLHVEAALKEASEKAYFRDSNGFVCKTEENKKSILNSYPLENIK